MKVLVMGLGLHGGGLETARYLLRHGADVTVTDLRDERVLASSVEKLNGAVREAGRNAAAVRYVLGRHEIQDFENADLVMKNPGVSPDSIFLRAAQRIETDISLFLAASPARLNVVTGTKGKSSTVSAIHWVLSLAHGGEHAPLPAGKARYGGNITVSPLTFLDELEAADDVTLELSSWQLGDLNGRLREDGTPLLKPRAAALTAIMSDHLDRYQTMDAYVADKRIIYQGQDENDFTVAGNDAWGRSFHRESRGRPLVYSPAPLEGEAEGGWLTGPDGPGLVRLRKSLPGLEAGRTVELVPAEPLIPGFHQKQNLLTAGLVLLSLGLDPECILKGLGSFDGLKHRLELFHRARGIEFYNDSAATIPESAAAAILALGRDAPLTLVTGGTDKKLDFAPLVQAAPLAKKIVLLAGSGSEKLSRLFDGAGIAYQGPFDSLDQAVNAALEDAAPGSRVALSPGCASFGMFLNEFNRGDQWKAAVLRLA